MKRMFMGLLFACMTIPVMAADHAQSFPSVLAHWREQTGVLGLWVRWTPHKMVAFHLVDLGKGRVRGIVVVSKIGKKDYRVKDEYKDLWGQDSGGKLDLNAGLMTGTIKGKVLITRYDGGESTRYVRMTLAEYVDKHAGMEQSAETTRMFNIYHKDHDVVVKKANAYTESVKTSYGKAKAFVRRIKGYLSANRRCLVEAEASTPVMKQFEVAWVPPAACFNGPTGTQLHYPQFIAALVKQREESQRKGVALQARFITLESHLKTLSVRVKWNILSIVGLGMHSLKRGEKLMSQDRKQLDYLFRKEIDYAREMEPRIQKTANRIRKLYPTVY